MLKKRHLDIRIHIFIQILFLHVTNKTIDIFLVCAFDVCPVFTFVVFATLKVPAAWVILFSRSSFKAAFMFSSVHFAFFYFGISDIFLWEKIDGRLNGHLLI